MEWLLSKKHLGLSDDLLRKLLKADNLDDFTDDVLKALKNSDGYADEIIEQIIKYGDDAATPVRRAASRDRNIPARYARGEIEITAGQAMDWTAAEDIETAQLQVAALGIPVTGLVSEGKTVAVRMEHVWVEAYVPYTDYRGAGNRGGESLWIPLDPAFKSLTWLEGVDLFYLSGYINQESNTVQEDTELYGVNIGEISIIPDTVRKKDIGTAGTIR